MKEGMAYDEHTLFIKYQQERALRLGNGGVAQYRSVQEPGLVSYDADPSTLQRTDRQPISAQFEVVVVGGGYAGMIVAINLLERGVDNIAIIDKATDFGGTWYWNRYPGAQCDVESYIYMPFLEECNYVPTEKYASASELFSHAQSIGHRFDLYSKAIFATEVRCLRWQDQKAMWQVQTDLQDFIEAKWVVLCPGNQSKPKLPGCRGIENFQGRSFHTCRWDYAYTGGSNTEPLSLLQSRRVGIIGTGASAVQVLPKVAASAGQVYVFQRTPSSVSVRNNRPTDERWALSLQPGWQRKRMCNFQAVTSGSTQEDLVQDSWTKFLPLIAGFTRQAATAADDNRQQPWEKPQQTADFQVMEEIRERVSREVTRDPKTAAALMPWYNFLCKRPCFHDEYLQAFNRPNVTLVDTLGKGVDSITERGIVANGQEFQLDCIIWATGFEWQTEWTRRTGIQVYGRNGLQLSQKWSNGISTFHGWGVNGFPNLQLITHAQSGLSVNYTHSALHKGAHLAYVIKECRDRGYRVVEPSEAAEAAWGNLCVAVGQSRKQFLDGCTPGYLNNEGQVDDKVTRANPFIGGQDEYERILAAWREDGELYGLLFE
ncbi:Baeyer-Villiger monooxygenase ATR8 [Pseudocercospora fuligena]|uniref:Baeyer-Villiger monooxygenase ATR8 n=1 Tax=Pseudocercospora fuligena TaxID=685502 RepID=A0A8H6RNM6_9PEZI|nr:Baeyer-Villiger monooxygenase ATR8 [Pseudocercospora fuligena]